MATAMGAASMSRNHANGSFSVKRTVYRSSASTRSTSRSVVASTLPGTVRNRSTLQRTSSAVSSRPLTGGFGCHRTPRRSLKTYVVSVGCVHDSARSPSMGNVPGVTAGPALWRTRRLCVKDRAACVLKLDVSMPSKCNGSTPRRARVPPRFGGPSVPAAQARVVGVSTVPAAAPPARASSRRRVRGTMPSSPLEPGGDEPATVVVTEIRAIVLERAVRDGRVDLAHRRRVVHLLREVALQLVDDLTALRRVGGAALANHHIRRYGIVHVALILELAGIVVTEEVVVGVEKRRLRAERHRVELAVEA